MQKTGTVYIVLFEMKLVENGAVQSISYILSLDLWLQI